MKNRIGGGKMKKGSKGMFRKLLVMGALAIFSMIAIAPVTYGQAPPVLSVTPTLLDFGNVVVGQSKNLDFTVRNTGGGTLIGSAPAFGLGFSIVGSPSFSLAAGASATVTVRFSPAFSADFFSVAPFTSDAGVLDRKVSGAGVGAGVPILHVIPASLDFGNVVVGQYSIRNFTVTNTGSGILDGKALFMWGDPFSVVSGSPFSLLAGASTTVTVRFSPTVAGFFGEGFNFFSTGGNLSREVSGWGTAPVPPPPPPPAPGAGGCFIATAVYGTPMAEEVEVLSRFRDQYLLTNELGRRFVSLYYRHSPAMAEYISDREWAKRVVRIALLPLVRIAEFIVGE